MANKNKDFLDYIMGEVFQDIVGITARPMFGGYGLYKDRIFFGLIADNALYFKVDKRTRANYEKHGSKPFRYAVKNRGWVTLSYWELPAEIMEDKETLEVWIKKAVRAKVASTKRLPSARPFIRLRN